MLKFESHIEHTHGQYWMSNSLVQTGHGQLKVIDDGTDVYTIGFTHGNKDDFAVLVTKNGKRSWLRDAKYFDFMATLAKSTSTALVMGDIYTIYQHVQNSAIDTDFLHNGIAELTTHYAKPLQTTLNAFFSYLLLAFTAEWAYVNSFRGYVTKIGPKVKLVGFAQVLLDHLPAAQAACWSRGLPARDIQREADKYLAVLAPVVAI